MPKSNYPDKLDTSVEIPVVRDNITEIGSDVLNSLRSAIFNVEKALGINPQGATGNTVSARLSNALDENGNILKDALDRSNVLSGPVTDADVSKVAAINESKLRLNFPTHLLQDQISILDNRLAVFILTLEELNAILSAHVHSDAIDRHPAQAITVDAAEAEESSSGTLALEDGTLQEVLEEIYNSHMNYTGESITSNNNSHIAGQVFYNNAYTSDLISSSSVQGAVDELAALEGAGLRNSNLNFNSNGIIRTGSAYNAFEASDIGTELIEASEITYGGPYGESTLKISFPDKPTPTSTLEAFDVLTILDAPNEEDNKEYIIASVELNADNDLDYVLVFGGPKNTLTSGTTAKATKSTYINYNENGLNCSVRPRYSHSNTPDVQIALPDAATIISSGIMPTNLVEDSVDTIAIEIDGGTAVEIPVFDDGFEKQSIDIIVYKINRYIVENNLNIFAYKVRSLRCFELAITHILPSLEEDMQNRTLKLVEASSNDASEVLGLSYLLDREVEGSSGNAYHINGRLLEDFGQVKTYTSDAIMINTGTVTMDVVSGDFIVDGIREGDLCVIGGSTESDDDGTYRIKSVDNDTLTLDVTGAILQGEISDDSMVFIIRCTAPIGELEFTNLGSDALLMFDVFIDHNKDVFYKKRMDMAGHLDSGGFYAVVSDVSSWFIRNDEEYILRVDTSALATLEQSPVGVPGEAVDVGTSGSYKIFSEDGMSYVVLEVQTSGVPSGALSTVLTGAGVLPPSVLHLCRGIYSTNYGFILGTESTGGATGIPRVIDKRTTGTVDDTVISEPLLERYIQGPRNELRASGVIRALDIDEVDDNDDGTCSITVNPGIVVVNGVRFEYLGVTGLTYRYGEDETDLNNFYVALDGHGCLIIDSETDSEISPFAEQTVANIGYVTIAGDDTAITDLRLFIDHIDYKLLGDITVANDQRFGHFTDIKAAVKYAKMFSKLFPDMGTPSVFIKEGTYEVEAGIVIDFDTTIRGAGPNTVIKRAASFALEGTHIQNITGDFIIKVGNYTSDDIVYGVTVENLTFVGTDGMTGYGNFIEVRHHVGGSYGNSETASFIFNNLKFIGASDYVSDAEGGIGGPNQMPFHVGTTGGDYQNIIISNCYFNKVGFQKGLILLEGSGSTHKNMNIINNISVNSIDTTSGYSMIREDTTGSVTTSNVQEVNNIIEEIS